jgi:adenylylsulfate kinase-like enzyme
LWYSLADCRKRKDIDSKTLYKKLNAGVLKQYQQVSAFWQSYQNPLEPLFKKSYDTYLKANNQTAGINSYSLVVSLLVHKYQKD